MFLDADSHDVFNIYLSTSVEYGKFGSIDLYQAVIDFRSVEGGHSVFYGTYRYVVFSQYGSALGIDYVFGDSVEHGLSVEVDTLYFVTVIFGSRQERDFDVEARMQTFALQGKATFQCLLFHFHISLLLGAL